MIRSYKSNPFYNVFLSLIIVIISIRFLINGSYELGIQTLISSEKGATPLLYLILIPCFYLYYKNLVNPKKQTYKLQDLKHFIYVILLYILNVNTTLKEGFLSNHRPVVNAALIAAFILFYSVLTYRLLSKNMWFKKDVLINNTHLNLIKNWTIYLFTFNILAYVILLASFYKEINTDAIISGKSLAPFSLVFWLLVFFKILISPEILYGLPILNKQLITSNTIESGAPEIESPINTNWILDTASEKNSKDLRLQEKIKSHISSYINGIEKLSREEHIFRNPKASPHDIANKLGVPTSHIVYLFKYHSTIPFSEYRMNSRIQDSLNLIKEGYLNSNTLESLAYKTGFASYNPFFSAFKKVTTHSPQDYIKLHKNGPVIKI